MTAPDSSDEGQQEDSQPAEDSPLAEDSQQNGDSSAERWETALLQQMTPRAEAQKHLTFRRRRDGGSTVRILT